MRPLVLLATVAACQPHGPSDAPPAEDTASAPTDDTDVVAPPFGLPPVDDACRARFPSARPDATTLARLVGTWTGFNGSGGTTTLTLGDDGTYAWRSDAGDYDLRDAAGTWSALAAGGRLALVLGDAVVPFRLDADTLMVENLDVGPGELRLTGGEGAASAPALPAPSPQVAWCAATAEPFRPTHLWAERPRPDTLALRPDGSVFATWADGCHAEGGAWAAWADTPERPPRLQWWLVAPCAEGVGTTWVGDLDLSGGWVGGDGDGDTWWPTSLATMAAVVDGSSPTFRLFGSAPATAQVGTPFTLDLTLRHRRDDSPAVDRVRLVQHLADDTTTDLAVAELGGVEIDADDVLPDNEEVPVRLVWTPTAAQVGRHTLELRVDWRAYGYDHFASVDVPLGLWVDVADTP